jgi:hypothetical protein
MKVGGIALIRTAFATVVGLVYVAGFAPVGLLPASVMIAPP